MSETKLKPCPFCGSGAEVVKHSFWDEKKKCFAYKTYSIKCNNCFAETYSFYDTEEFAIKVWNTRKPMDNIVEQLEEESQYCVPLGGKSFTGIKLDKAIDIVKRGGVE